MAEDQSNQDDGQETPEVTASPENDVQTTSTPTSEVMGEAKPTPSVRPPLPPPPPRPALAVPAPKAASTEDPSAPLSHAPPTIVADNASEVMDALEDAAEPEAESNSEPTPDSTQETAEDGITTTTTTANPAAAMQPMAEPASPPAPVSEDDLAAEHEQDQRHPLSALGRGAALLLGMAGSFGLAIWELAYRSALPAYVKSNKIDVGSRKTMLLMVILAVGLGVVWLGGYLYRRRRDIVAACHRIERVGWTLSPLILIGLVPLLFHWRLWKNNDIIFMVMVGFVGFCSQKLFYRSFSTPPIFADRRTWWDRVRERVDAIKADTASWLPWAIVIGVFLFYAIYFAFFTVQNHWNLRTSAYDLAIEDNVVYNAMYGEMLKASPMFGPTGIHLGHHATFFAFLLAPFYALSPQAETLLVIQAIIIGAAVIPLFLFARNRLGPWYAAIIAVLYVLYAPVHGANLYDFHYPPLGIGFVFWTAYLVDIKRYRWAALAIVLALSIREDIALQIFVVGAYFVLSNRRPKAGLIIAAVGIGYFVIMKMGVMPAVRGGKESFAWYYKDLIPPGGPKGFSGILATIGGNPGYTLSRLLQDEKILYILQIMTPFAFLPFRRGIGFVFCLPGLLMTLLAHRQASYQISFQYTAHWSIGMFLAVVIILTMLKRPAWPNDQKGAIRVRSWMWAMVLAMLATSYQHGAILQHNTARGGFMSFKFDRTEKDIKRYEALYSLIGQMPTDAKVASTERLLPHMSNRRDAYTLRTVGVRDAQFLIFPKRMSAKERDRVRPMLKDGVFGVMASEMDLYLAKRGYATDRNAKVLIKLGRPAKKRARSKPKKRKRPKAKPRSPTPVKKALEKTGGAPPFKVPKTLPLLRKEPARK